MVIAIFLEIEMKTITAKQYESLARLKLASNWYRFTMETFAEDARRITNDTEFGHTYDMIHGGRTLDETLKLMGISVVQDLQNDRTKPGMKFID